MAAFNRPLRDIPEDQLRKVIDANDAALGHPQETLRAEYARRIQAREVRRAFALSILSVVVATAALIVSVLRP